MITNFRLAAAILLATGAAVSAQSLTTAPSNNGSGGVFMDLTPTGTQLIVNSFEVSYTGTAGTPVQVEVWTRPGSYVGFDDSSFGWTLVDTVDGMRDGTANLTPLNLNNPISLPAGTTTAVYLHCITSGGGIRYNGTAASPPQTVWNNADLSLFSDVARTGNFPFAGSRFQPRTFAGTINYLVGDPTIMGSCCFGDGSCQNRNAQDCFNEGGVWQGANTDCANTTCPEPGACCFVGGACDVLLPAACAAQNGTYQGMGTTCAATNCPDLPTGQWIVMNSVPQARSRAAGAIVGDTFYFFGGEASGGDRFTTCWKLDILNNTWSPIADMPTNFIGFGGISNIDAAAIGSDIYIVGGWDGAAGSSRLLRYDTLTDTWEDMFSDPYPTTIYANAVVALDGKLYSIGGSLASGIYATESWVYDPAAPAGVRWSAIAPLPEQKQYLAGVAMNGRIYVAGGIQTTALEFNSVHEYNPATNEWTVLSPMSALRGGPALYDFDGELYAVGGGWATYHSSGEVFDGASWSSGDSVNVGMRTFAYDGNEQYMVKAGGWTGAFSDAVEVFVLGDEICYANCDQSTTPPILNVDDFTCFINEFASALNLPHEQQIVHYANCDNSTTAPVLNVDDFTCFINAFAAGCD